MIRDDAIEIWKAGVAAVHGRTLVENAVHLEETRLSIGEQEYDLKEFDRIVVVGGGKFSHFMAEGLEHALGNEVALEKSLAGLVSVPDGSNSQVSLRFIESVECRPAGINLPTQRVLDATERMLGLLQEADDRTLVIALISGGGSALLEKSGLPLEDVIAATNWLSRNGADILQLNTVRIALSDIKGGGLARAMPSGTMVGLIVSDVPGDDLRFVSSGPTVEFGEDIFQNAREIMDRFDVANSSSFPASVVKFLGEKPVRGTTTATISNVLIGDASVALTAAVAKARSLGYSLLFDTLEETQTCDQVADVVYSFCSQTRKARQCIINLGEPVVTPGEGAGQGGRNQHAVLLAAEKLVIDIPDGQFCFLSGGTDGEDGNTSVAGALFDYQAITGIAGQQSQIHDSIKRFDSHTFLSANQLVFESGPTGTNVADLRILLRGVRPTSQSAG